MSLKSIRHNVVWKDNNYFSAWPANGALWRFGDFEIGLCFIRARCDYLSEESVSHNLVVRERVILRSFDEGTTWDLDNLQSVPFGYSDFDSGEWTFDTPKNLKSGFDPNSEQFCLLPRFGLPPENAQHLAGICISADKGFTWSGPFRLPSNGYNHIGKPMRYVVLADGSILLFAYASEFVSKSIGLLTDVPSVIVVFTSSDGGVTWNVLSEITPEPLEPSIIMPYPIVLENGELIVATRRPYDGIRMYTQFYVSSDKGLTWSKRSRLNGWGAPACLTRLRNGNILCTYGYRNEPYGIKGSISKDDCFTWSDPFWIRDDGGSMDLGYPLTIVRSDGTLLTSYYFNTSDEVPQMNGGVRHIASSIYDLAEM